MFLIYEKNCFVTFFKIWIFFDTFQLDNYFFFVKQLRNSALKYDFVVVVRIELIPKQKIKEYSQSREIVCYEEKYIADNPTNTV